MTSTLSVALVASLLLLAMCAIALFRIQRDARSLRENNERLRDEHGEQQNAITRLEMELRAEKEKLQAREKWLKDSEENLTDRFRNLANQIFEDKSEQFEKRSKKSLDALLNPLKENIKSFEKRVGDTYEKETEQRISLKKEIEQLKELNSRISQDAENLTRALTKDSKAQGEWGELVLESILETSGLVNGREYEVQKSLTGEEGDRYRPDVIVHLPESRDIIIDSKVSLTAWTLFCAEETDEGRELRLKEHVKSVRNHMEGLASRNYQHLPGVNSLDYVFLFMPVEAAYAKAMEVDPGLFQDAFDRKVIFVVPATLITTLKTVDNLWRLERQNQNATEIAKKAGQLYDKFVGFAKSLEDVGRHIDASQRSYDDAHKKLVSGRGNLAKRAETLKELGAKTSKQLPAGLSDESEES